MSNRSNEKEDPTLTNQIYDRDDSLNDVISFGKQTPFRFEYGSQLIDDEQLENNSLNQFSNNSNKKQKRIDDTGIIDLNDQDYDFLNTINRQDNQQQQQSNLSTNDFLLNLKDTTIDDIYLIPESIKKKFLNKQNSSDINLTGLIENESLIKNNLIYQTPPASSRQRLSNSGTRLSSRKTANNSSIAYKSDSKLNTLATSPSRIPVAKMTPVRPQSRLSFANYDPRAVSSANSTTTQLKVSSSTNQISKPAVSTTLSKSTNLQSKAAAKTTSKPTGGAFKYYSNVNTNTAKAKINKTAKSIVNTKAISTDKLVDKRKPVERSIASTVTNLNYSIESDESIQLDDLLNNPAELKKKLKESKMDKEQLGQLQQNYLHLLEQYAEKENFIDKFRLGYDVNMNPNNSNSANNIQKVIIQTPSPKLTELQTKIHVSNSNDALGRGVDSAIDTYRHNSQIVQRSPSNEQQQGVFVITSFSNRLSSNSNLNSPGQEEINLISSSNHSGDHFDENIVVEQNSKLGILLQTKVLEEKMQSFVTLINEKQLNQIEQKQVFESIKNDYSNLLKNYQEIKRTDMSGVLPNELDMDIDLNKELDKMKDLLTNIVDKMSTNQIEKSSSRSTISEEQKSNGSRSSVSSYGNNNNEELMDQYNRLLDVFSNEPTSKQKNQSMNDNTENDNNDMPTNISSTSNTNFQQQKHHQSPIDSYLSNITTTVTSYQIQQPKNTRKSPKRTKQQLTPSNTSSESNKAPKKFIQTNDPQPTYNNQSRATNKEFQEEEQLIKRTPMQRKADEEDDLDYNDIIEVESDLLDNSFINDAEEDDEIDQEEEEEIQHYNQFESSFKQYNNIRKANFDEPPESEYENYNLIARTSSSSHYKSSSSSSSIQQKQVFNIQKPQLAAKQEKRSSLNSQKIEPIKNKPIRSKKALSLAQPSQDWDEENEEQERTVLYINDDYNHRNQQKKQLKQQTNDFIRNNFNPSSSSSSNSMVAKPLNGQQHIKSSSSANESSTSLNHKANKVNKIQPVAKAYEGSESDELLESLDQFDNEYESAAVEMVANEVNKRHNYHKQQSQFEHVNQREKQSIKTSKTQQSLNNRRYSSYETGNFIAGSNEIAQRQLLNKKINRNDLKSDTLSEFSHSTEISSSMIDLNRKSKQSSRNSNKAELMKQLAEEVESLKQQILKKHLNKIRDSTNTNENMKKMKKSQSYQNYQSLKEEVSKPQEVPILEKAKTKTTRNHNVQSKKPDDETKHRYSHRLSKQMDDKTCQKTIEKAIPNSKSLDNLKQNQNLKSKNDIIEKRQYIVSDETSSSKSRHQIASTKPVEKNIPVQNMTPYCTHPDNLLCYDSHGRLVTILPNNPFFLQPSNRGTFPLNEIHPNIVEQQKKVLLNTMNTNKPTFNNMQTQTQLETLYNKNLHPQVIPQAAPTKIYNQQTTNVNNTSSTSHSKRRIRYYIREYGDASPTSDTEATYNRSEESSRDDEFMATNYPVNNNTFEHENTCDDNTLKKICHDRKVYVEDANKLEKMFKKAFKYAHDLRSQSKRIKNKILTFNSINV